MLLLGKKTDFLLSQNIHKPIIFLSKCHNEHDKSLDGIPRSSLLYMIRKFEKMKEKLTYLLLRNRNSEIVFDLTFSQLR